MLPDEESIYPPPVLYKDIMELQLFMGCFARKKFDMIRQIARTVILKK